MQSGGWIFTRGWREAIVLEVRHKHTWTMKTPRSQKRLHFHALSMIYVRVDAGLSWFQYPNHMVFPLDCTPGARTWRVTTEHATYLLPEVLISQKWRLPCASSRALPLTEGSPFISLLLPDNPHSARRAFGEEAFPPIWQGAVSYHSRVCSRSTYFYKSGTKHKTIFNTNTLVD